jgi:glycolate oxidase iron-sulfur subunit
MQTNFTTEQLKDPHIAEANGILRNCVHCGFCTATCPTYVLLGDELDSPRGRIYLIKNMLEKNEPATVETVKHIDRCLSCLACMTTCPSGVNYMHLIDQARVHVEETYKRPLFERLLRSVLGFTMPRPKLFSLALLGARIAKPMFPLLGVKQLTALASLVPERPATREDLGPPNVYPAEGKKLGRVALLMGCVQSVVEPAINAATIRLLTRRGYEVVVSGEEVCCGSLTHHMGKEADALARAKRSVDQWTKADVDTVIVTASGCGTTIKDYGFMLRLDETYAAPAAAIAKKARDIPENCAWPIIRPVPCSMARRSGARRKTCCGVRVLRWSMFRKAISAAGLPAPIISCSPRLLQNSVTARWPIFCPPRQTSLPPEISAVSRRLQREPKSLLFTALNFWIGLMADQNL